MGRPAPPGGDPWSSRSPPHPPGWRRARSRLAAGDPDRTGGAHGPDHRIADRARALADAGHVPDVASGVDLDALGPLLDDDPVMREAAQDAVEWGGEADPVE